MTLMFSKKQIYRELKRMERVKELGWEDIIKERLNNNLKNYIRDINSLINTISHKNSNSVLRRIH